MQSVLQRLLYAMIPMNYSSMNSKSNEKMCVIVQFFLHVFYEWDSFFHQSHHLQHSYRYFSEIIEEKVDPTDNEMLSRD